MRRFLLLPIVVLLAGVGWFPTAGAAQGQPVPSVTLRMASQSVWNAADRPLRITVAATNNGVEPLTGLTVTLQVRSPTRSRSVYELSMRADATAGPILAASKVEPGSIQPGETRRFSIAQPLRELAARNESALYPVSVLLLSNDVVTATLRTPMIFLIEPPEVPLNLQWSWVLAEPVQFTPEGTFLPGSLESDIGPAGSLSAMITALDNPKGGPADVVVSPVLVDQLLRMADGYRIQSTDGEVTDVPPGQGGAADAGRLLSALRRVASRPATDLSTTPFADPQIPSLVQAGLGDDLSTLTERGRALVGDALGRTPISGVLRPPLSRIDVASLGRVTDLGARILLLDTGYLPTPIGLTFAPQPVVNLAHGTLSATAVVPDEGVATMAAASRADPLLAARAALGELAAIWFEHPGTAGRGASVLFPERPQYPAEFYGAFATAVRSSPWLKRLTATQLAGRVAADRTADLPVRRIQPLDSFYVTRLLQARQAVARFSGTMQGADALVDRLNTGLLVAEGGEAVEDQSLGTRFVSHAEQTIQRTYAGVQVVGSLVSLYSQAGTLPIRVRNDTPYRARVRIQLVTGPRLAATDGGTRQLTLAKGDREIFFQVRALTTGRFPIKVQVVTDTPGTPETIAETQLIVRSTAYNRVALFLTIGAALFLLAWWGRRFLPRRRT